MDKTKLLIRLGRELGIPVPILHVGYRVTDKKGRIISDQRGPGHSWTRNFYNLIFCAAADNGGDGGSTFGAGYMSAKTMAGTIYAGTNYTAERYNYQLLGYGLNNNANNSNFGILAGTDNTAFDINQYKLLAAIAHGNEAGQLFHQAQTAPTIAYTAGTKTWKASRSRLFNNNSGATITVKESGLANLYDMFHGGNTYNLIERNVPDPAIDVANGAQLTITYEIAMVFPD